MTTRIYTLNADELRTKEEDLSGVLDELCIKAEQETEVRKKLEKIKEIFESQKRQLEITTAKLQGLILKDDGLNSEIRTLNFRRELLEKDVESIRVISVIAVDDEGKYGLMNGLVDVNRDVMIKILRISGSISKTRAIIGIADIFYVWAHRPAFQWAVVSFIVDLPLSFIPNPHFTSVDEPLVVCGHTVVWRSWSKSSSFFVKPEISRGVNRVSFQCSGNLSFCSIGVGLKKLFMALSNTTLWQYEAGTSSLRWNNLYCGSTEVVHALFFPQKCEKAVCVSLELDVRARVLYFFVDGVQIPHCVCRVPRGVCFGVSNELEKAQVTLRSQANLAAPTVRQTVVCVQHAWKD